MAEEKPATQGLPLGVEPRAGAAALALGLLAAAAFPPLGWWPLNIIAIALLLRLLRDQDVQTARNLGLVFGISYSAATMHWFFGLFHVLAIPLVGLMAGYFGLFGTLVGLTREQPALLRAALAALFAVGVEWLRGDAWYLRFPWYTPPHALAAEPLCIGWVRWVGTYGYSYLLWFIAALGAFRHPVLWLAFLFVPVGGWLLPEVLAADQKVLLVQAEGDEAVEPLFSTVPVTRVALAVLPEYAYFRSPKGALATETGPRSLAIKLGCPVVFGAIEGDYDSGKFSNVAAVTDASGKLMGTFPKQRPVPLFKDGKPGDRRPLFPLAGGVLGVAICYDFDAPEVAGSLVAGGATVLVAPTFDNMEWTAIQHQQHEWLTRLRAVENDRWLLRCASSGRTEVINPRGVPSERGVEIGETGHVVLDFAHRDSFALGGRLAWLGPLAGVLSALWLARLALLHWRRARQASPATP